ncbi:MAG: hypothetical protein H6656_18360 [Ardenticatenaceae bacterium]|nr:hypothetical protein [Ardenticatenaceae bacterium]
MLGEDWQTAVLRGSHRRNRTFTQPTIHRHLGQIEMSWKGRGSDSQPGSLNFKPAPDEQSLPFAPFLFSRGTRQGENGTAVSATSPTEYDQLPNPKPSPYINGWSVRRAACAGTKTPATTFTPPPRHSDQWSFQATVATFLPLG